MSISLEDLRRRIKECDRCGKNNFWHFPIIDGVKGFLGNKDYIFVAAQPHLGGFPVTRNDERLYINMAKYGFTEAHLTDVVKCRGEKYKKLTTREVDNCVGWLDEEVRIVKPKAIITLGTKAFDALMSIRRFRPVLSMNHYSAQISNAEYEKEFEILRSCLDADNYLHGMKIRDVIGQEIGKLEKPDKEYSQYVALLNELRREERISAEKWREFNSRWTKDPNTRTLLFEQLRVLQRNKP